MEDFFGCITQIIVAMLTKLRKMGRVHSVCQYFVVDLLAEYNMPQYVLLQVWRRPSIIRAIGTVTK